MKEALYDVMVIGGGCAGLCAAIQAGRAGAKTVLIERSGITGGALTAAGINYPGIFNAWGKQVIAGIGWELVEKSLQEMNTPLPDFSTLAMKPHWKLHVGVDSIVFAAIADRALLDAGVDLRYHTMLGALHDENNAWRATLCGKDGLYDLSAKIVIDCTGDANAAHMADYECRQPSPCQPGTYSVYATGYDIEKLDLEAIGNAFNQAMADGEIIPEDTGWAKRFNPNFLHHHGGNSNHICGINAADSEGRTKIEIAGRESLLRLFRFFRRQPGLENLQFLPKAAECGVRETRTIVGETTVTVDDYTQGRVFPEALCYSFYPIDLHDAAVGLDKRDLAEGIVPTVPRGALIPKNSHRFLAAGRIISSDRLANSALRVQATCMATGQAAAAVATLAARENVEPRDLPLASIRTLLQQHAAILP